MTPKTFLLDTNIIADLSNPVPNPTVAGHLRNNSQQTICLCTPVIYEVERGWEYRQAQAKLHDFRQNIIPRFTLVPTQLTDWRIAARLWADARRRGRQLSDVDLLIAAIAIRLSATIVSSDEDFKALPVQWENWRVP